MEQIITVCRPDHAALASMHHQSLKDHISYTIKTQNMHFERKLGYLSMDK